MSLDAVAEILGAGLAKIFGSKNEKELRRVEPAIVQTNALETRTMRLSDAEMREKTEEFRKRLSDGQTLDDILPEAFALVRESARRHLGERHYDVQILGGIMLHQGRIAEMVTGEGKTLVATCPTYLNALARGMNGSDSDARNASHVHVITVNDYLARRDANWMRPVYEALGLTVGCIQSDMDSSERHAEYACDITYGTNNEFGFDYLRDNMKIDPAMQVQKVRHFAVIDEVDSALVDEARTPLIISGGAEETAQKYYEADQVAKSLRTRQGGGKDGIYFKTDEKDHNVTLSEEGMNAAAELLGMKSADEIYTGANMDWPHFIDNALKANNLYVLDVNYVVKDGEVLIVDEFTGRLQPGRRWSDGLHQAVEAAEGLQIREETQTLATITFQNFFRLYDKISGMTGTAMTEAKEFMKIYKLDCVAIPPNRPLRRRGYSDVIYGSEREKFDAIVEEIVTAHQAGRPVLVGTISIEKSERLGKLLARRGVDHEVLNAKHHEREAQIVAHAGEIGKVTVATNMAGRGTDIKLGSFSHSELVEFWKSTGLAPKTLKSTGDPEAMQRKLDRHWASIFLSPDEAAKAPEDPAKLRAALEKRWAKLGMAPLELCESVAGLGGLHIIGTERHEARRIDNQLRGRSGRQGDPGSSRFFLSLEDDLMRIFAKAWVANFLRRWGLSEGVPLESRMVSRQLRKAQLRVEEHNFGIRRRLLEYDEVMNEQRTLIYAKRQRALEGEALAEEIQQMIEETVSGNVLRALWPPPEPPRTPLRRVEELCTWVRSNLGAAMKPAEVLGINLASLPREVLEARIRERIEDARVEDEIPAKYADALNRMDFNVADVVETVFSDPAAEGASDAVIARAIAAGIRQRFGARLDADGLTALTGERVEELTGGHLETEDPAEVAGRILTTAAASVGGKLGKLPRESVAAIIEDACRGKVEHEVFDADSAATAAARMGSLAEWVESSFHLQAKAHELLGVSAGALERMETAEFLLHDPDDVEARLAALVLAPLAEGKLRLEESDVAAFLEGAVENAVRLQLSSAEAASNDYDKTRSLVSWAKRKFDVQVDAAAILPEVTAAVREGDLHCDRIEAEVLGKVRAAFAAKEEEIGAEAMRQIERFVVLDVIDKKWKDHLRDMDQLKEGIWMRSYAQKNPRIAYKQEGYELFSDMMAAYREEVTDLVLRARPIAAPIEEELSDRWDISDLGRGELGGFGEREEMTEASEHGGAEWRPTETIVRTERRVKPNEPCPCGSGKKYKHCCMRKDRSSSGGGGGKGEQG